MSLTAVTAVGLRRPRVSASQPACRCPCGARVQGPTSEHAAQSELREQPVFSLVHASKPARRTVVMPGKVQHPVCHVQSELQRGPTGDAGAAAAARSRLPPLRIRRRPRDIRAGHNLTVERPSVHGGSQVEREYVCAARVAESPGM